MKAIIISNDVLSFKKVINSVDANADIEILKSFSSLNNVYNFVSNSDIDVIFVDITTEKELKIKFIHNIRKYKDKIFIVLISDNKEDSFIAYNLHAIGFLLKPYELEQIIEQLECIKKIYHKIQKKVEIKTFGNFCVLIDGKPIKFELAKSKEILAYLIYKQGTEVNWPTLAAEIFDEDRYDNATYERVHKAVVKMKCCLKQNRIDYILNCSKGYLSININEVNCDLYRFINGDITAMGSYFGEFMSEYPWAEDRTAYLDRILKIQNI